MTESTKEGGYLRCGCGRLYVFMSMYVGDQSVCGDCRRRLEEEYREQQSRDKKT